MSDPNIYWGSGKGGTQVGLCNVVAAFGVDNTGATDIGASLTAALAALVGSGQEAWIPAGTYNCATAPTLAGSTLLRISPEAVFTGAGATQLLALGSDTQVMASSVPRNSLWNTFQPPASAHYIGGVPAPLGTSVRAALFNTTTDFVWFAGYNPANALAAEPSARWGIEANFEQVPGQYTMEMYAEFLDPGFESGNSTRPFFSQFIRSNSSVGSPPIGTTIVAVTWNDAGGGPGTGYFNLEEKTLGGIISFKSSYMTVEPTVYTLYSTQFLQFQTLTNAGGAAPCGYQFIDESNTCQFVFDWANERIYADLTSVQVFLVNDTVFGFGVPVGGNSVAFQYKSASIALGHGGTTTLTSAQYDKPTLLLTDSTLTSAATVVLPTTTGPTEWRVNTLGVTFAGFTVTLQVGTAVTTIVLSAGTIITVYSDGIGNLYSAPQGLGFTVEDSVIQASNLIVQPPQSSDATNFGGGNLTARFQTPGGSGTHAVLDIQEGSGASYTSYLQLGFNGGQSEINAPTTGGLLINSGGYINLVTPGGQNIYYGADTQNFRSASNALQLQLTTSMASWYAPLGGASGTPLALANNGAGIAVGAGGTFTPSAAQLANPRTALTGNITATSSVIIALPNLAGEYRFDVTGLTLGANTLSFTSGSQTITYTAAQMPHGGLIVVSSQGGNTLACCP